MLASLVGCGSARQILTTQALPVIITPPTPSWDVGVGIEMKDALLVRVENRGSEPLSVVWEESSYIDVDQRSHPLIPDSAASVGRMPRSVLPPGTRLEERLTPVSSRTESQLDPLMANLEPGAWWRPFDKKEPLRIGSEVPWDHPSLGREMGLFLVLERDGSKRTILAKYKLASTLAP